MSEWISVDDRLPEYSDDVLFVNSGGCVSIGYLSRHYHKKNRVLFIDKINTNYGDWTDDSEVTHWQPLPPPPQC